MKLGLVSGGWHWAMLIFSLIIRKEDELGKDFKYWVTNSVVNTVLINLWMTPEGTEGERRFWGKPGNTCCNQGDSRNVEIWESYSKWKKTMKTRRHKCENTKYIRTLTYPMLESNRWAIFLKSLLRCSSVLYQRTSMSFYHFLTWFLFYSIV